MVFQQVVGSVVSQIFHRLIEVSLGIIRLVHVGSHDESPVGSFISRGNVKRARHFSPDNVNSFLNSVWSFRYHDCSRTLAAAK